MENRPELRVVDVERIAGGILDQPGDDLRRLNSNLPVGVSTGADVPPQRTAEDEDTGDRPA
jgi:hypothetical protein